MPVTIYEEDCSFAEIVLNRPEKRNALNKTLIDAIKRRMETAAEKDSVRAVILVGNGKVFCDGVFCAGADLKELSGASEKNRAAFFESLGSMLSTIHDFPKPVIAAINGVALGGGAALASVCDYVVIDEWAKIGYPETTRGLLPALAAAYLMPQIGERQTRRLLIGGEVVGAEEALRIGLVTHVCNSADDALSVAEGIATKLADCGPQAIAATKSLLRDLAWHYTANARIAESRAVEHFGSVEAAEGFMSFLEKREPNWRKQ